MTSRLLLKIISLVFAFPAFSQIRISCIGASITHGHGLPNPQHDSYPGQLQKLLGQNYLVNNFGVSGTTLLSTGDFPYRKTAAYRAALQSNPDIVVIDLGGNDSKLINRVHLAEYENDYAELIDTFRMLPSHPRIIIMLPVPSFVTDTTAIWNPVIVSQIIPKAKQVAFDKKVEVLDMHSILIDKAAWMPDKIHPNTEGAGVIAEKLYNAVSQKKDTVFNIFTEIKYPLKISSFNGYACADFVLDGREAKIVQPKWSAPGHPWVWRARFWGHEPQAEIALLERGFHIVYSDVSELFGNKEAIQRWNKFYKILHQSGLSQKAVMEGMSRGAVYVLNWAAENSGKVACVYIDNPVLDLKSWPAGLGRVAASKQELELLKQDFHLTNEADIKHFKGSPLDKVKQIVKGNYPILILCADADEALPPEENTLLFERKMKEQNGQVTVIHKPGFKHHPHSLPNPTPIVNFVLQNSAQLLQ